MPIAHSFRAPVDIARPEPWGICDRCGFRYPLSRLDYQHEWRGASLVNLRLRVCRDRCLDKPQEQFRVILIGPDPVPVYDPRPGAFAAGASWLIPGLGTTQGGATPIQTSIAVGSPVTSANNSFLLPATGGGNFIAFLNRGAATAQVWPQPFAGIEALGLEEPAPVLPGSAAGFWAQSAAEWRIVSGSAVILGALGGLVTVPDRIITAAGNNRATAAALGNASGIVLITGGSGGGYLPPASAGLFLAVANRCGADINAYPFSNADAIEGLGGGNPALVQDGTLSNGGATVFFCPQNGQWNVM